MTDLAEVLIAEEEGRERCAYQDSRELWTIGIGALVDKSIPGAGLCDEAIAAQFAHDSARARVEAAKVPSYFRFGEVRQAVLISMCFQLGSLHGWPKFQRALYLGDWDAAAEEGMNSLWAKQTPRRAQRAMRMIRTGVWEPRL